MSDYTKIKPYGKNVLIRVLPPEQVGIILSDEEKDKPIRGEVLAVGDVPDIKVGDVIIYDYYSAVEFHQAEQEFLLISQDDILGVEEK
jgi:chaperonin GroES